MNLVRVRENGSTYSVISVNYLFFEGEFWFFRDSLLVFVVAIYCEFHPFKLLFVLSQLSVALFANVISTYWSFKTNYVVLPPRSCLFSKRISHWNEFFSMCKTPDLVKSAYKTLALRRNTEIIMLFSGDCSANYIHAHQAFKGLWFRSKSATQRLPQKMKPQFRRG